MLRQTRLAIVALAVVAIGVTWLAFARATMPIAYESTWTDPSGKVWPVSFAGTRSGSSVSGTVVVGKVQLEVVAAIASDGSVTATGRLPNGKTVVTYSGAPATANKDVVQGQITIGSAVFPLTTPNLLATASE